MPIYEYLCERCGRVSEVMQKVNDRPPAACPECGSKRLAKLVSRSAFQLKGGGWYADLYGSSKKKEASAQPGPEVAGKAAASGAGSDAAGAGPGPAAAGSGRPEAAPARKPDRAGGKKAAKKG